MSHPTERLADYVDGSLSEGERRGVEAHLDTCEQCRGEVQQAREVRRLLRELPEIDVPAGVVSPVLREAQGAPARRHGRPRPDAQSRGQVVWRRAMVTAASIAALVAALFVFSGLRQEPMREATGGAAAVQGASPFMEQGIDEPGRFDSDGDFNAAELHALADQTAKRLGPAPGGSTALEGSGSTDAPATAPQPQPSVPASPAGTGGGEPAADTGTDKAGLRVSNESAFRKCLRTIGAFDHNGELVEAIKANYLGDPAYIIVIAEGPVAGAPHDRVAVWAVGRNDCDVVAFSQTYFPPATPTPAPTTYLNPPSG